MTATFATVSEAVTGATGASRLALDGGAVGYGFGSRDGYVAGAWASAGAASVTGHGLGVDATTALVTSAVDGSAHHRRVDRLALGADPLLVEPDQLVVAKRHGSNASRLKLTLDCPAASAFGHCRGTLKAVDKRGRMVGKVAYRVKPGDAERAHLRLDPHAREPRRVRADAARCAAGRSCRSFLRP